MFLFYVFQSHVSHNWSFLLIYFLLFETFFISIQKNKKPTVELVGFLFLVNLIVN